MPKPTGERLAPLAAMLPRLERVGRLSELSEASGAGQDSVEPVTWLALPSAPGGQPGQLAGPGSLRRFLQHRYGIDLAEELARADFTGEVGSLAQIRVSHPADALEALLVLGVGAGDPVQARRAGAALARRVRGQFGVGVHAAGLDPASLRAMLEGLLLAGYTFSRRSTAAPAGSAPPRRLVVVGAPGRAGAEAVRRAEVTARAVHRARDLANTPSSEKHPQWLAEQARRLAEQTGLRVRVWDEAQLRSGGFGAILGVGAGSARPPRLVELGYLPTGASARTPHVVLVGKGITFDSGGLSLKRPYDTMVAMKTDMAGAGAVIAVLAALADLGVRVRVTGLVAAAENMPGGSAQRPGDVVVHHGGRTTEVRDTDAEGRLVLADALAYADTTLDPDVLLDVATLTGAATLGLGRRHAPLFGTDARLVASLVRAGQASGELVWPMPLVEEYRPALDSEVADLANVTRDPHVRAGSIVAALFLREFVGARRWAHLDIAGTGRADADEHETVKGPTGFGTRLLLRWLEGLRPADLRGTADLRAGGGGAR